MHARAGDALHASERLDLDRAELRKVRHRRPSANAAAAAAETAELDIRDLTNALTSSAVMRPF